MLDRYDTPAKPNASRPEIKPWLMVYFECCHAYGRLQRNRAATQYSGRCPRCGGRVTARIGAGGTTQRMFRAG